MELNALMEVTDSPHMWATFAVILMAVYLYVSEKLPVIVTSSCIIAMLLGLFHFFPLSAESGARRITSEDLFDGFSNPALLAVLSLLVLGQAVVRTGSLNTVSNIVLKSARITPGVAVFIIFVIVAAVSGFINDTPTVVIFMPIMLAIAQALNLSASRMMIPLSYAAILGGVITLIGSSTNLLVSGGLVTLGLDPIGFFDFTIPGLIIAAVGMLYVAFVLPGLLPDRAPIADELTGGGRQFVAQLEIRQNSPLIGKSIKDPKLFGGEEVTIRMLQRREQAYLAPFEQDITIERDDIIVVVATREAIKKLLSDQGKTMFRTSSTLPSEVEADSKDQKAGESALCEILITPGSKLIGQTVEQIGFHHNYHAIVLGIQRKSRMITARMTGIRLAAGDVLLIMGARERLRALRKNPDMVVMEWATEDLPSPKYALRVNAVFAAVILASATNLVPIHIGGFIGALIVVLMGCLNVRQAMRAIEVPIIFMVAAGLAMSTALQQTGGASFLAQTLIDAMAGAEPVFIMSALFLLMAMITNVLSNNATALLFTPIAVNTAQQLGVPPEMFIYAVIFACNSCSIATPISYQTNLLVMGPGHYKFADYLRAGTPLIIIIWLTYSIFSYFYF